MTPVRARYGTIAPAPQYSNICACGMRSENHAAAANAAVIRLLKMEVDIKSLSCESVRSYVKKRIPTISDSVFEKIREHKRDDEVFLSLNDEYLRGIAPLLGDQLKIKRVITAALSNAATVSFVEILFHVLRSSLPTSFYSFLILRLRAYQRRWFQHLVP